MSQPRRSSMFLPPVTNSPDNKNILVKNRPLQKSTTDLNKTQRRFSFIEQIKLFEKNTKSVSKNASPGKQYPIIKDGEQSNRLSQIGNLNPASTRISRILTGTVNPIIIIPKQKKKADKVKRALKSYKVDYIYIYIYYRLHL